MMPLASRIGQTVAHGRYLVQEQIGRGSFGDVYLTQQLGPGGIPVGGAPVVLKILHPQWAQVEQVVERFRRESMITTKIEHPHVGRVFEFGQLDDGVPFIAMEYLPGRSLRDVMREGAFDLSRACAVLAPVCEALAAAHRAGVVHRDLKPENIQIVSRGGNAEYPVVLDFGVAKFLDAAEKLTMTGAVLGTPAYMPPEQYRGEQDLGPPADVYALGVLAFELCAGRPPFQGRNFAELAVAHTTQPAPPLPGVPTEIAKVVARCLDKDPARRPTADVLGRALRTAAAALPSAGSKHPPQAALKETIRAGESPLHRDQLATVLSDPLQRWDQNGKQPQKQPEAAAPPTPASAAALSSRQLWTVGLAFLATLCMLGAALLIHQLMK